MNLSADFADSDKDVQVGDWALAVGSPLGLKMTVTQGIISAKGRLLHLLDLVELIQTDAAINPGNSGGPLTNALGEVIGVNSSIFSNSGGSVGLGFAIPINRVTRVVDDLLSHGSIRSPWIGITLRSRQSTNPRDVLTQGAIIATVAPGSPAAAAGLQAGDVILREGGRTIHNPFDWQAALLDLRVGSPAQLHMSENTDEAELARLLPLLRQAAVDIAFTPEGAVA